MAINEISVEIPENFFEDYEWNDLEDLFKRQNNEGLEENLKKVILAALKEYKEMFLGRGLPSRADEIQQYRLFCLIKNYFGVEHFPSESEVAEMFQLTQSKSKSLIRLILTRYHYDLKEEIEHILIKTVNDADPYDDDEVSGYIVTIPSDIIVEELNRIINKNAPKCFIIRKIPGTARRYRISDETYSQLEKHFKIGEYATE